MMAHYTTEFNGNYGRDGGYQEALSETWHEYQKIEDDEARKELHRLCMYLLYHGDDGCAHVLDPIQVILDRASFAQRYGEEARNRFFVERQMLGFSAMSLIGDIK